MIGLLHILDKEDIEEDFFITRCYGDHLLKDEIRVIYDNLYKITYSFKFSFTIHKNHITLDEITTEYPLYQFEFVKKYITFINVNKWYMLKIENSIVFNRDDT